MAFGGFWSGLHAGRDAASGLGQGMVATKAAAAGKAAAGVMRTNCRPSHTPTATTRPIKPSESEPTIAERAAS